MEKCATLPRVFDFDLSNPWEGLRVAPKMCHFTKRSVAFNRSTKPIHCKNQGAERFDNMCNFTSRSVPRPRQSIVKIDELRLTVGKCVILPRVFASDLANPWEGLLRHAKKSETCVILPLVFDLDLSNLWEGVTRRADDVSFYEAFRRSTRPIHGKGCIPDGGVGAGSRFRKNI